MKAPRDPFKVGALLLLALICVLLLLAAALILGLASMAPSVPL